VGTVSKPPASKSRAGAAEPDPYRYGWRYVPTIAADGSEAFDQVALTPEDVLHPEFGDFIADSSAQTDDLDYLKQVFKERLSVDPTAIALRKHRVEWNIPGLRPLAPDLALFFGVCRQIGWSTFNVAAEGARPAMVIEVTSPDTRSNDVGIKVDYYHRAGVPLYVIADVSKEKDGDRRIELIRYDRTPQR
jgi:colicin import membrane protein